MPEYEKGIIQLNVQRVLPKVNQVIYTIYPNCTPDIMILAQGVLYLFRSQVMQLRVLHNMPKSKKGDFLSNIYGSSPKHNQVIYTLDTNYIPNTMLLAQAVIQILKYLRLKRGIIQSNIHRISPTINQVSNIMYLNCVPDIMIIAQAALQICVSQDCFNIQNVKVRQGT